MTLRTRTLLRLGVTLAGLMLLLFVLAKVVVIGAFEKLERQFAMQSGVRSEAVIQSECDDIGRKLIDWSNWDDTYEFIESPSDKYVQSNMQCETLEAMSLAHIVIVSAAGELTHAASCPGVEGESDFVDLVRNRMTSLMDGSTDCLVGLVESGGNAKIIAIRPVLRSNGDGPAKGVIAFARIFDRELIDRVSTLTRTDVEISRVSDPEQGFPDAAFIPEEGRVDVSRPGRVDAYRIIDDFFGRPIFVVRSSSPRSIHGLGREVLLYFVSGVLLAGAAYGGVLTSTLARTVLSRLTQLSREVAFIGHGGDLTRRVTTAVHRDELGLLADEINRMLDTADRSQNSLRESENRLRNVIETAGSAIVGLGVDRTVVHWNREAEDVFGLSRGAAAGTDFVVRFVEGSSRGRAAQALASALDGAVVRGVEFPVVGPGRSARTLLWNLAPEFDGQGRCVGLIAIGQDITDRTAAERELLARTRELEFARSAAETASRAKSEFLANMSHEIRTPMTAILGFTELLADAELPPDARREHLVTIRRNGEHLLSIINDILDLSKIEAGRMAVERIVCSPLTIVDEVIALMQDRAAAKQISLSREITPPLPAKIRTDPVRLRQILVNLVGNAVKFTETGGVTVRLTFERTPTPRMRFDVIDTGIGLSEEQVGRLFQAFTQADTSTTRQFGGTGLGLVISRRLATLLDGDITLVSDSGKGSVFTLTVGAGEVEAAPMLDAAPNAAAASPAAGTAESARLTGRVLLAEDGIDNQRLLMLHLRRAGFEVELAENGRQAIDCIRAAERDGRPFELVIMDMQMPVLDGYQAATELRASGCGIPIIAATAHAMSDDRARCLDAGCSDYITKPIVREALLNACARWIGQAHEPAPART